MKLSAWATEIVDGVRRLDRLDRESARAADARSELPPGSSRKRVTTANARWMRKAEARDLARMQLVDAIRRASLGGVP